MLTSLFSSLSEPGSNRTELDTTLGLSRGFFPAFMASSIYEVLRLISHANHFVKGRRVAQHPLELDLSHLFLYPIILGNPGADSGDEKKSKLAGKIYGTKKSNARRDKFSGTNQKPERRRPFGTGLVRHCPQGLFSPFLTFLRAIYFSARLDFSSSPLSAPGSPRMVPYSVYSID